MVQQRLGDMSCYLLLLIWNKSWYKFCVLVISIQELFQILVQSKNFEWRFISRHLHTFLKRSLLYKFCRFRVPVRKIACFHCYRACSTFIAPTSGSTGAWLPPMYSSTTGGNVRSPITACFPSYQGRIQLTVGNSPLIEVRKKGEIENAFLLQICTDVLWIENAKTLRKNIVFHGINEIFLRVE